LVWSRVDANVKQVEQNGEADGEDGGR
jgi:hypothetical protein